MRVVTSGGEDITLGTTETTPTISIIDYSRRETDDFGVTTVVERGFARRLSVRMSIPSESVDSVQQILAGLRATSAQWIADDDYLWLNVEGFYKEFELDFATPALSYCTLTVEGLAETEVVADTGGDPAPLGSTSTLRLLQPVTVTDAVLSASNVPENDYPEWAAGTTYALGARVIKASLHRIFESAGAGNVGHDPAALSGEWIDIGPTNRWAMFDQALGSATAKASPLAVTLAAGTVNAVALLDVVGTSVRVQTTGYDQTKAVGSGAIIFLDIPATGAAVTVTVTGVGTLSAGTLLVGTLVSLGITETSPTAGITDFSKKDVDEFGEVTVVPRAWAKRMAAKALIRSDSVDVVANRLAAVRAVPSLWIADEGTDSLTVYGFFKDFSLEVGEGVSILSLSVEGLSKAETINPLAVTDLAGTGTLAADDYVYFGTGGTIKEAIGGADATLPGFRTDLGTAAAIAGQGSGATANNLTQLNPTEGTKLGTVATGATKNRTFYGSPDPATVPANAVADGDKWIDATVVPNIYKERLGGAWVDAAARGAQTGVSLYRDTGLLLTQADVRTAEGTAAAIAGQGALATKSAVAYGTADVTGFGSLAARSNVRLQNEVYRADGATLLTDAAAVTSLGTAAAISGQGAFATLSSAAYGSSLLTGFGTVAARNNVRIGTELVRADGITATSDAGLVTSLGTAAAISGQGSYATLSQTYFGDGLLKETSGGVTATLANFKTSSGTAAAISGQGALATKSTATYGTADVTGFGTLAARANVRIGTEVVRADGTTATSDAALVTSLGTAAAISGQGSLATKSTVTYGTGDVTGFGALAAKSTATYGTGDVTGFGTLAARANVRIGTEVVRADGTTATSDAVLVTSLGTAAAISGQGALATLSAVALDTQVTDGATYKRYSTVEQTKVSSVGYNATAGRNQIPNGGAENGLVAPWAYGYEVTNGGGLSSFAADSANANSGKYCFALAKAATGDGGQAIHPAFSFQPGEVYSWRIRAKGNAPSGTGFYFVMREKDSTGAPGSFITVGGAIVQTSETVFVNNQPVTAAYQTWEGTYTVPAGIYFGSLALANWIGGPTGLYLDDVEFIKQTTYLNLSSTAVRLGVNVTRNDGSTSLTDALAVTSLGTAAAISGQGSYATLSQTYFGDGLLKETSGGATATLANFKTSSGTASAISGQGSYATLSQTYFGDGLLKETSGGVTATLANFKTSSGTSAAIAGQGSFATLSQTYFGDGLLKETSGGITATLANFKTSSGTAAAITGQGTGATANSISQLNATEGTKFASVGYGATAGRNLVLNPGAESNTVLPWGTGYESIAGAGLSSFTVDGSNANSGKYCFALNKAAGGDGGQVNHPAFSVQPGETYAWRIKAKGNAGGSGFYFVAREKNNTGSPGIYIVNTVLGGGAAVETSETVLVNNVSVTTSYQTWEGTYTVPAGIYYVGLGIANYVGGPTVVYVDDIEFYKQSSYLDLTSTAGRLGTNIVRNDGATSLTDAAAVTSLGTAAAIAGQGTLATLNSVDPSTSQVKTLGSIPPTTPDNSFSYTSTTTTVTISWPNMTIYRADGTTISIGSGSQAITTLTAGTTYKVYPYVADSGGSSGSIAFVTGGAGVGAPAMAYASSGNAAASAAMAARGNIPLTSFSVSTPASGSGGGGGGGFIDRR